MTTIKEVGYEEKKINFSYFLTQPIKIVRKSQRFLYKDLKFDKNASA